MHIARARAFHTIMRIGSHRLTRSVQHCLISFHCGGTGSPASGRHEPGTRKAIDRTGRLAHLATLSSTPAREETAARTWNHLAAPMFITVFSA